jgi:lipid A 3-O-deacylase
VRQCSCLIAALLLAAPAADVARAESDEVVDLPPGRAFPAIEEFRIGAMEPVDGPGQDKGGSPDINLEFLLGRFGPQYQNALWNHFLRPRLHFGGSLSTNGGTNLAYAGLTWDVFLTRRLFIEATFGGAIHDGPDNVFGGSVTFRESASVGVMLSDRWDVMATVDHMSNANLRDENRGLTMVGLRLGRKF